MLDICHIAVGFRLELLLNAIVCPAQSLNRENVTDAQPDRKHPIISHVGFEDVAFCANGRL